MSISINYTIYNNNLKLNFYIKKKSHKPEIWEFLAAVNGIAPGIIYYERVVWRAGHIRVCALVGKLRVFKSLAHGTQSL